MSLPFDGPWSWDGKYPITIKDANGDYVVSGGIMPSRAADAELIAAAPRLYNMLYQTLNQLVNQPGYSVELADRASQELHRLATLWRKHNEDR